MTSYAGTPGLAPPAGTVYTPTPNVTVTVQQPVNSGISGAKTPVPFGPVLAQATTDAQGHYSIPLAPGYYAVSVISSTSKASTGVTVVTGQFITGDIQLATNQN